MNLENYLKNVLYEFNGLKKQAEKAMVQISDDQFFQLIDPEANSIALIVKHIAGNQHSRWSDFLTTDGEKDFRYRDNEFLIFENDSRKSLMTYWENGWKILFDTIESLTPDDLKKTIQIRSKDHFVYEAINRQLTHYASHVGEIILLAKHFKGKDWQTLSIAKGQSENFNKKMFNK